LPTVGKFANASFIICGIISITIFFIELSQGEFMWDALLLGIPFLMLFLIAFMKK